MKSFHVSLWNFLLLQIKTVWNSSCEYDWQTTNFPETYWTLHLVSIRTWNLNWRIRYAKTHIFSFSSYSEFFNLLWVIMIYDDNWVKFYALSLTISFKNLTSIFYISAQLFKINGSSYKAVKNDFYSFSYCREGSVVVLAVLSLDTKFKGSSSSKLAQEINQADTIAGYRFDRSYTKDEGIAIINY